MNDAREPGTSVNGSIRQDQPPPALEGVTEVERITMEEMEHLSPDGRPPGPAVDRKIWVTGVVVAAIVTGGAAAILYFGGVATLGMLLIYMGIMLVAAFPFWASALLRHGEHRRAEHRAQRVVRTRWRRWIPRRTVHH